MHRRTSIYLDDSAMRALKLLAAATGTTVSEKIREAVDTMLAAQVDQVDWASEIEGMLERARDRNLPELSGDEMMAEVKAVRAERPSAAPRCFRYDRLDERFSITSLDFSVAVDHASMPQRACPTRPELRDCP